MQPDPDIDPIRLAQAALADVLDLRSANHMKWSQALKDYQQTFRVVDTMTPEARKAQRKDATRRIEQATRKDKELGDQVRQLKADLKKRGADPDDVD